MSNTLYLVGELEFMKQLALREFNVELTTEELNRLKFTIIYYTAYLNYSLEEKLTMSDYEKFYSRIVRNYIKTGRLKHVDDYVEYSAEFFYIPLVLFEADDAKTYYSLHRTFEQQDELTILSKEYSSLIKERSDFNLARNLFTNLFNFKPFENMTPFSSLIMELGVEHYSKSSDKDSDINKEVSSIVQSRVSLYYTIGETLRRRAVSVSNPYPTENKLVYAADLTLSLNLLSQHYSFPEAFSKLAEGAAINVDYKRWCSYFKSETDYQSMPVSWWKELV